MSKKSHGCKLNNLHPDVADPQQIWLSDFAAVIIAEK